jgi:hypothetical protein
LAKKSPNHCHWRVLDLPTGILADIDSVYDKLSFPPKTEMAYQLDVEPEFGYNAASSFIVAFSIDVVQFKPSKLKFLSGIAVAIFIAAFDLDEEPEETEDHKELDVKEFVPKRTYHSSLNLPALERSEQGYNSSLNLAAMEGSNLAALLAAVGLKDSTETGTDDTDSAVGLEISTSTKHTVPLSDTAPEATAPANPPASQSEAAASIPEPTSASSITPEIPATVEHTEPLPPTPPPAAAAASVPQTPVPPPVIPGPISISRVTVTSPEKSDDEEDESTHEQQVVRYKGKVAAKTETDRPMRSHNAPVPTWVSNCYFAFPIADIPVKYAIYNNLTLESFTEVQHIADGSNANVFLGKLHGKKVVIKMIKEQVERDPIAIQEFDLEYGILARVKHPNIIRLMGAGNRPRRFIVLEYLSGGSLNTMLMQNQQSSSSSFTQKLFRKPTFTYTNLLRIARAMAEALDYLHHRCHSGATIIHRGELCSLLLFYNSNFISIYVLFK